MPAAKSKSAKKAAKPKKSTASKHKAKLEIETSQNATTVAHQPASVFETFKADKTLQGGLSIVRSLGGGMYEIVSLKYVHRDDISSEETGRIIKSIPGRRAVLDISQEEWEDAKLKCGQAIRSAGKRLHDQSSLAS